MWWPREERLEKQKCRKREMRDEPSWMRRRRQKRMEMTRRGAARVETGERGESAPDREDDQEVVMDESGPDRSQEDVEVVLTLGREGTAEIAREAGREEGPGSGGIGRGGGAEVEEEETEVEVGIGNVIAPSRLLEVHRALGI